MMPLSVVRTTLLSIMSCRAPKMPCMPQLSSVPRASVDRALALSNTMLQVLQARGYRYDASTFPTFIGPLARYYYFRNSSLTAEQQEEQSLLFGQFSDGFRSLKPYHWDLPNGTLLELPVSTIPVLRAPFHITYLSYLAGLSPQVALAYFGMALRACRLRGVEPSLLLHPLDFLGADDVDGLQAFPGMQQQSTAKLQLINAILARYQASFEVLPMLQYCEQSLASRTLDSKRPAADSVSPSPAKSAP